MQKTIAPALTALLDGFIDYAGLFPPAKVPLGEALSNYEHYIKGEYAWMLRWFVVAANEASQIPEAMSGKLSILADSDNPRAATLESTSVIAAAHPVYCEVPIKELKKLEGVKQSGNFAKIRTGGLKPEAIPSPADVSAFILACADLRLPFKATAGLHHPIRKEYALTYESDAPRAVMHGFINVLLASAFAWHGEKQIEPIISEMDATAFSFDGAAHWQGKSLSAAQIRDARANFIHSVGSCSFDEPVHDLQTLGLL